MDITYEAFTARNVGLVLEQEALRHSTVSIAGCGGAGGAAAVTLARMGLGSLRLADPDVFDQSNLNRQWGASAESIGVNKAEVVASEVRRDSPFCEVDVFAAGVTAANVRDFCRSSKLVIEAIDYWSPVPTVMLHRECRAAGIPVLSAVPVGWGSTLLLFEPDSMTFEEYIGRSATDELDSFSGGAYPLEAYCPEPPPYVQPVLLAGIAVGDVDIPVVAPGVNMTAAMLGAFAYFRISGERSLTPVPHYYSPSDLMTLEPRILSTDDAL